MTHSFVTALVYVEEMNLAQRNYSQHLKVSSISLDGKKIVAPPFDNFHWFLGATSVLMILH